LVDVQLLTYETPIDRRWLPLFLHTDRNRVLGMVQMNLTVPHRPNNAKCLAEPIRI